MEKEKVLVVEQRFGLAIRNWRKSLGISQEELAWRAQLHRTYISDIERGERNPSLQTIEKLAKALKLPFSTLFQPLGESPHMVGTTLADPHVIRRRAIEEGGEVNHGRHE